MTGSLLIKMVFTLSLTLASARAESLSGVETHAFLSQGYIKTTDNNYLAKSKFGSFNFTEVGINFTKHLNDDLRTGIQLFARNLGPTGDFNAKLDWFYLDYHYSDALGLRLGRVKLPFGLYNDTSDIDMARAPILLPQSIYPTQNRDFLLAQTGMELYGRKRIGLFGDLDYRAYGGTILVDIENTPGSAVEVKELNVPYVAGGRLLWETPLEGLRVGATAQALRLDTTLLYGGVTTVKGQVPALLWVGSIEYWKDSLLLSAEYSRWHVKVAESSNTALLPASNTTSERAYGMASYRLNKWLQPATYYSILYPNVDNREGRANSQHDLAATLRFDINQHWLVKVEGHYMWGTAGLSTALNDNISLNDLKNRWAAFLIKTTAYF